MARQFKLVVVMGTGMTGPGIAATLALGGVDATLLSRSIESANRGLQEAERLIDYLHGQRLVEQSNVQAAKLRLHVSADVKEAVSDTDLVIESLPEEMEFKQKVFQQLDETARPDTVLASNTSGLSITAIALLCTRHPERCADNALLEPAAPYAAG